jgi:hypothetical protein
MHSILMDLQGRLQFEILEKKNCARVFRLDDASVKDLLCWMLEVQQFHPGSS